MAQKEGICSLGTANCCDADLKTISFMTDSAMTNVYKTIIYILCLNFGIFVCRKP